MRLSHIYFHRDFDGVACAALVLRSAESGSGGSPSLESVDYGLPWTERQLSKPCAVVDFLYHPDPTFFWDHHASSFSTEQLAQHYRDRKERGDSVWCDTSHPSCASLIFSTLPQLGKDPSLVELRKWADIIDTASYSSVEQVIQPSEAALKLNLALGSASEHFYNTVVEYLTHSPLDSVIANPDVGTRIEEAQKLQFQELRYFQERMNSDAGVVSADVSGRVLSHSRYAPYHFDRDALYSVVLQQGSTGLKLLCMRNPWIEFDSLHLGNLCRGFGGGGHKRVGAVAFRPREDERAV